jgi:hypothetical protein
VKFFRTSLAFALFAALAVLPVSGASVRHHSASGHAAAHSSSVTRGARAKHSDDADATVRSAHGRHGSRLTARKGRGRHSADDADATQQEAQVTRGRRHSAPVKVARSHGQQAIDSDRVTEIQQALIREHYLTGEASGSWDETTKDAMTKYQADRGWQTKLVPDSRALKNLGLGPDYSNAINAKNASFAAPPPSRTIPQEQSAGFAQAAGVNQ